MPDDSSLAAPVRNSQKEHKGQLEGAKNTVLAFVAFSPTTRVKLVESKKESGAVSFSVTSHESAKVDALGRAKVSVLYDGESEADARKAYEAICRNSESADGDSGFAPSENERIEDASEENLTVFCEPYYICEVRRGDHGDAVVELFDANTLVICEGHKIRARELRDGELVNEGA